MVLWAAFGVGAAVRVLHATAPFGLGVSGDSLQYMSAALDMAAGETVKGWNDGMYVSWPPLYPALLMAFSRLGGGLLETARYLNVAALGGTVFIVGALSLRHVQSLYVRAFGTAIICTSVTFFEMSSMMWSEPIFLLVLTAQLATLVAFLETRLKALLVLAAVLASAATMQRYPGVTIIGVSGLAILYPMANTKFQWRVVQAAVFGVIAAAPLAIWLKRNKDLEGIATSWAGGKTIPIPENLVSAFDVVFTWLIPSSPIYRFASVVIFALVGPLILYALWRSGIEKRVRMPLVLYTFFAVVYTAFLCYSGSRYSIEPINLRYLSPVFIPMAIVAVTLLDLAIGYWRQDNVMRGRGGAVAIVMLVLSTAWLYYPFASAGILSDRYRRDGVFGFTKAMYVNSPLIESAQDYLTPDVAVYSNQPELLFVNADAALAQPYVSDDALEESINDAEAVNKPVYLVWFGSSGRDPNLMPNAGLLSKGQLLSDMPEGTIYSWPARR